MADYFRFSLYRSSLYLFYNFCKCFNSFFYILIAHFYRDKSNIIGQLKINFISAILGDRIKIPYFGEEIEVEIPSGTQPGSEIIIKNKGLPDPKTRRRGDLILKIQVELPEKVSEEGKSLLKKFAEIEGIKEFKNGLETHQKNKKKKETNTQKHQKTPKNTKSRIT